MEASVPSLLFFQVEVETVLEIACFHASWNPGRWRGFQVGG